MTNYNKRLNLDDVLERYRLFANMAYSEVEDGFRTADEFKDLALPKVLDEAKQAITSLIKELVAEAKPGNYTLKGHQPDACLNHEKYTSACCGCQRKRARLEALDQFEQNLLKALEEV